MRSSSHVCHPAKAALLRDFCHYSVIESRCEDCGEPMRDVHQRDFTADPMLVAFADPECETCREMLKGREPAAWLGLRNGR